MLLCVAVFPSSGYLVKRDDPTSTSPFQLQVMSPRSTNKRILAQKTIYAAYHSVPPTEMGTWQVHQRCTHSDGSWWCFEPSHLEKSTRAYGNFDIISGPFLAHSQPSPTLHCPCTVVSLLPMLIGS